MIDTDDIENMRRIADAFAKDRFEVFILFAKLSPFTETEIALAMALNGPYAAANAGSGLQVTGS